MKRITAFLVIGFFVAACGGPDYQAYCESVAHAAGADYDKIKIEEAVVAEEKEGTVVYLILTMERDLGLTDKRRMSCTFPPGDTEGKASRIVLDGRVLGADELSTFNARLSG